jgi:hypothetical protein
MPRVSPVRFYSFMERTIRVLRFRGGRRVFEAVSDARKIFESFPHVGHASIAKRKPEAWARAVAEVLNRAARNT